MKTACAPLEHPEQGNVDSGTTGRSVARGTALGVVLAVPATTVVFAIGNLGSPIRVVTGWHPQGADLTVAEVLVTVTISVLAGGVLLWFMDRRRVDWFRPWTAVAGVVTIASAIPLLRLHIDAGSKVSLATMHLLTGIAAIAGQAVMRREPPVAHHGCERTDNRGPGASSAPFGDGAARC